MNPSFERAEPRLALCGLICVLCPMYVDHYCPGCGGGLGNQVCNRARCSQKKTQVSYCFECEDYPCDYYQGFNQSDSFISHHNQHQILMRIESEGIETIIEEVLSKRRILDELLMNFNDGRHKRFYCLTVNLLSLEDLNEVMKSLSDRPMDDVKIKAKSAKEMFLKKAEERGIQLVLRK